VSRLYLYEGADGALYLTDHELVVVDYQWVGEALGRDAARWEELPRWPLVEVGLGHDTSRAWEEAGEVRWGGGVLVAVYDRDTGELQVVGDPGEEAARVLGGV